MAFLYDKRNWILFVRSLIIVCCLLTIRSVSGYADVRINELLALTNEEDEFGTPLEWIEIFNSGPDSVDLVEYTLTDDPLNPRKWNFPRYTLPANGYFLVLTTGYDYYNPGEYHSNFRLDADGEFLGLYKSADLALVDTITYPAQERDVSFGRDPDNTERWLYFDPTPGESNASEGYAGRAAEPQFSIPGGVYENAVTVELTADDPGAEIRYTLDGSSPLKSSLLYSSPISIAKNAPLRARTFREDYSPSDIVTHTYFVGEEKRLAKLSIVTDDGNLFDRQKGIYANASQSGVDWERPASFEYIYPDGERWFGVDAGIRIHGGASRQRSDKKSFRVYFRKEYGPGRLKLPVIPTTDVANFDSFILRAGYNDSWIHWDDMERTVAVYISDQMGRDVHEDMGFVTSHGIFTELYLNGEYWGLYNLCERYDGDYFESYYGDEEWDIVNDDEIKEGDRTEWNRLQQFVSGNNMRLEENYQQLLTMIDVEQVTAYYILNIFVQNHDWPHHNWYAARERRDDGKWKLFVWDIEDSFGSGASRGTYNQNTFSVAQQGGFLGTLFSKLLQSDSYKVFFKERLDHYLATVLSPSHLLPLLDDLASQVRVAMPFEAERWNQNKSAEDWEAALDIARDFINNRARYVLQHVENSLQLPTLTPTPRATPTPGVPTPTPGGSTPTPTVTPTPTSTPIQPIPGSELGIFDANADIGVVGAEGDASYDSQSGVYTVTGSGEDIWGNADGFHFLYKEIEGDFSIEAKLDGINLGTNNWAKICLMARDTLDADAAHFASRVQESTFQASSQWRLSAGDSSGSTSGDLRVNLDRNDCRMRVTRDGNLFTTFYWDGAASAWTTLDSQSVVMDDPIYVGLAVTSHDDGRYARGLYEDVKLTGPNVAVACWMMY